MLASFIRDAVGDESTVRIQQEVVVDSPAAALLARSDDADLLVVGARGLGGFGGLLLGSVSQRCLHHSTVPVAVVRTSTTEGGEPPGVGRVVVGVDESDAARTAVKWAVTEARLRNAELEIVHAWEPPYTWTYPYATPIDEAPFERAAHDLVEALASAPEVRELPHPPLRSVVLGDPRRTILDAAARADVVVLGARGVSAVRGMLLGSVSDAVSQRAPCPVVVVPATDEDLGWSP